MFDALIVDDNVHNRRVFRIALEHAGYTVFEAEDGNMGLDVLQSQAYHLLVVDLAMPGMDGMELLARFRGSMAWNDPVVMVVTANPHMTNDAVNEIADYILQKPIDVKHFTQLVTRIKQMFN